MKKCKKCMGDDFCIQEILFHKAALNSDDENLTVYKDKAGGIERIFCAKCDEDYSESDFKKINFR